MRAARDPMNSVDGFRRPLHTTYRGEMQTSSSTGSSQVRYPFNASRPQLGMLLHGGFA